MKKKNLSLIKNSCFVCFLGVTQVGFSSPPASPSMEKISINNLDVNVSWTPVEGASGYELFYAPYPYVDYINSIDMGNKTSLSLTLWEGATYYSAIKAYNLDGSSDYSNIEHFGRSCFIPPQGKINLPKDEMFHSEPQEWWYWTGHLQTEDGRWFGFEQTVFLFQMFGQTLQMVHHAITDIESGTFHFTEKTKLAVPLKQTSGFNWDIKGLTAQSSDGIDTLHGEVDDYVLDLTLQATKQAVFQYEDGYTDYTFGGNTYYYSKERMTTKGTLKIGDEELAVKGTAWFDHQWGDMDKTTALGWDWFGIQLDDNREIILFNINVSEKENNKLTTGSSIYDDDCQVSIYQADEVEITPLDEWVSPHSLCTYPQKWDIRVGDLNLTVTPVMADQEIRSNTQMPIYWEGAAIVSGDATGRAYVELTGYCNGDGKK